MGLASAAVELSEPLAQRRCSLGSTGFLWHHESNAKYGPRATFCERNLFVTVGPTPGSLELAETLYSAFR